MKTKKHKPNAPSSKQQRQNKYFRNVTQWLYINSVLGKIEPRMRWLTNIFEKIPVKIQYESWKSFAKSYSIYVKPDKLNKLLYTREIRTK